METAPSPAAIEDGFLAAAVERMEARWRTSAGRIERYAPQVAEAWRQAAEDAERAPIEPLMRQASWPVEAKAPADFYPEEEALMRFLERGKGGGG